MMQQQEQEEAVTYLTQEQAVEIDQLLIGPLAFSVDQLMELAGLSVACAIAEVYNPCKFNRVLVICGPGDNGGDGLVAARHLHHFGYKPSICYPKQTPKALYTSLVTQLESLSVPFLSVESFSERLGNEFGIVVDAIFGFSFHGTPRPPFDDLLHRLASSRETDDKSPPVIVSVDIPSGWHVEEGDTSGKGLKPDMLVSLTAPKLCAKWFNGLHHFLGGRFVPNSIIDKFKLRLPPYPGTSMCTRIDKPIRVSAENLEQHVETNPFIQFEKWYIDAVKARLKEPNAMALSTASKDGKPSLRMVSLKGFTEEGFVWCTSYRSRKARELSENPYGSILFYWNELNRQVRVEGLVEKLSDEESEQYFRSRPRDLQIAPAITYESAVISGRQVLEQKYKEIDEKHSDGNTIPRPAHWGGYRLVSERFEFWQGDESSVHLKLQYFQEEIDGRKRWRIIL